MKAHWNGFLGWLLQEERTWFILYWPDHIPVMNRFRWQVVHLNCFWWSRGTPFYDGLYFRKFLMSTIANSSFLFCNVTDNLLLCKGHFGEIIQICAGTKLSAGSTWLLWATKRPSVLRHFVVMSLADAVGPASSASSAFASFLMFIVSLSSLSVSLSIIEK